MIDPHPPGVELGNVLGERIRLARIEAGLSLQQLAERMNVSKVSIWAWERGRSRPRPESLKLLSDALALPIEELIPEAGLSDAPIVDVVASCRERIAQKAGVPLQDVEITINFSAPQD